MRERLLVRTLCRARGIAEVNFFVEHEEALVRPSDLVEQLPPDDPRAAGRSNYGFIRLATHALNVLTGFTTRPLRVATLIGLALTLMGVGILVLVLVRYFAEGDKVPGFPFLASIISIFSGAQLLTLGLIGEYLARIHVRVMDRPPYALREELGNGS